MGGGVAEPQGFTCANATAQFLRRRTPNRTAHLFGEGGLLNALHHVGHTCADHDPDEVVGGEGRTINMGMIA